MTIFALLLNATIASTVNVAQEVRWDHAGALDLSFAEEISALYVEPNGVLYLGTSSGRGCGDYCGSDGRVYRSLDDGRTWEFIPFDGSGVTDFAALPDGDLLLGSLEGLYRSDESGTTWHDIPTGNIEGWIHDVHVTLGGDLYIGLGGVPGVVAGGILMSADGGQTWVEQALNPSPEFMPVAVNSIAGTESERLVAATSWGIYRSDRQDAWTLVAFDSLRIDRAVGLAGGPYFATMWDRESDREVLYRSQDGGKTWLMRELPTSHVVDLIAAADGSILLSGEGRLYTSATAGDTWQRRSEITGRIALTAENHIVVARTDGHLFRSTAPVGLQHDGRPLDVPSNYRLGPFHPNPFSGSTAVTVSIETPTYIMLEVFDVWGRKVRTLADRFVGAGRHTFYFQAGALAGGVYVSRLTAGGLSETRTLILFR